MQGCPGQYGPKVRGCPSPVWLCPAARVPSIPRLLFFVSLQGFMGHPGEQVRPCLVVYPVAPAGTDGGQGHGQLAVAGRPRGRAGKKGMRGGEWDVVMMEGWDGLGCCGKWGKARTWLLHPMTHNLAPDRVTSLQGPPGEAGYDGVDGEQVSCAVAHCTSQPVRPPLHPGTDTQVGPGTATASSLLPRVKRGPPATPERRGPGGGRYGTARLSLGEALPPSPTAWLLNPFLLPSLRGGKVPGVPGGRRVPQALAARW